PRKYGHAGGERSRPGTPAASKVAGTERIITVDSARALGNTDPTRAGVAVTTTAVTTRPAGTDSAAESALVVTRAMAATATMPRNLGPVPLRLWRNPPGPGSPPLLVPRPRRLAAAALPAWA